MEATDEAWRAFCHAASACPDINGEAEVRATKERLLALQQEEALHYDMRFNRADTCANGPKRAKTRQ